jgi:hypothetical protein
VDGEEEWSSWLRIGANGAQAAHEESAVRTGPFRCGSSSDDLHTQVTFNVSRSMQDGEMIRVRLRYTDSTNVAREVYGLIRDSGKGRFSISYPRCGDGMELILDWRRGKTPGIQSQAYVGIPRSACVGEPMTNRRYLSGSIAGPASGLLRTGTGPEGIVLGASLTPVAVR